ncbi:MAG: N-acetylmuramoyl-L-alanine amidase [Acidobacteria bacterium]|nr:N-acetylmuramoyl-L-alanine amidase [Acidobacteriota bacterium]
MTNTRLSILKAATALVLCSVAGISQTPDAPQPAVPSPPKPLPSFYRNVVVIDPAHGGPDNGAQLPDDVLERNVTLAFAQKLRPLLAAQGFAVTATRDSDPTEMLTADQRAGMANHSRPLACLLLHATSSGTGIHVASSSLSATDDMQPRALRWDAAQAGSAAMSLRLANEVGLALSNAHLPVVLLRASVPPIDNLTCPAIIVEIAPLVPAGGSRSPVTDATYQQHVAEAIALGLASFRTHNAPAPAAPSPTPRPATSEASPAPKPASPAPAAKPEAKPPVTAPAANPGAPR